MHHRSLVVSALALSMATAPLTVRAADSDVRVNAAGYLPDLAKRASISASATSFQVKKDADDSIAFQGTVTGPKTEAGVSAWTADFSTLTEEGQYYLEVPGVGRSATFTIGAGAYEEAFLASMLGFYGWRCNTAVSLIWRGQPYSHAACHMDDAHTDHIGAAGARDGKKGWHDAGDYGKYTVNAGITVGSMLQAWEDFQPALSSFSLPIPEAGGALPDYLDEIKWELEWVLTMQYSATDGRVSHKLTSLDFDPFEMPELDLLTRYFVPWSSAATADFVAMLAKASRIYRAAGDTAFADRCLAAAQVSYEYLKANTADVKPDQSDFKTGGYTTRNADDPDDRLWAAAEMWETTGDAAALADFETRANAQTTKVDSDFDWGNVKNLGMFVYVLSKRTGRNATLVGAVETALKAAADKLVSARNASVFGRDLAGYYWGSSGAVVRSCMVLQSANRISPNPDYVDTCADQVGWVFGRNQYGRSQVTGMGVNPPMNPHHRPSGGDSIANPWPGLLVGGGQSATDWVDIQDSYQTNEVAINWNAGLVYALAGLLPTGASNPVDGGVPDSASGTGGQSGGTGGRDGGGSGGDGGHGGSDGSGGSGSGGTAVDGGSSAASAGKGCGCGIADAPASGALLALFFGFVIATRRRRGRA